MNLSCALREIQSVLWKTAQHMVEKQRGESRPFLETDTLSPKALLDPRKAFLNGRLSESIADEKRILWGKVSPYPTSLFYI